MEQVIDQDLSERIRGRAYEIWIASGHRDGEADQHWLAAEQEILSKPALRGRGKRSRKTDQRPGNG
jgi:hypothetical protein